MELKVEDRAKVVRGGFKGERGRVVERREADGYMKLEFDRHSAVRWFHPEELSAVASSAPELGREVYVGSGPYKGTRGKLCAINRTHTAGKIQVGDHVVGWVRFERMQFEGAK